MINRNQLEELLNKYFTVISFNKSKTKEFTGALNRKHGVIEAYARAVVARIDKLDTLSEEQLFWYGETASNLSKNDKINILDYYSDSEIEMYKNSKYSVQDSIYPVELPDMLPIGVDQWIGVITADKLFEFYNNQIINYEPKTQRNPIVDYSQGSPRLSINVNEASVESIRGLLEKHQFIPNAITLNIRLDKDTNEFDWDESSRLLTLRRGSFDIIDGYHRYKALIREKAKNPDFKFTFALYVMNFSTEKARRFIAQEDKRNKINALYVKTLDDTRLEQTVATQLNEDTKFYLNGAFKSYGKTNLHMGNVITAIGDAFRIENPQSAVKLAKGLATDINAIIDDTEEEFDLLTTITDYDLRIIFYTLSIVHDDPNKINKTINMIRYFRNNPIYQKRAYSTIIEIIKKEVK